MQAAKIVEEANTLTNPSLISHQSKLFDPINQQ